MEIHIGLRCTISFEPNSQEFARARMTYGDATVDGLRSFVFSATEESTLGEVEFLRSDPPPMEVIQYLAREKIRITFYPPVAQRAVPKGEHRIICLPTTGDK